MLPATIVRNVTNLMHSENGLRQLFYVCSLGASGGVVASGIAKDSDKRVKSGLYFAAANIGSIILLQKLQRTGGYSALNAGMKIALVSSLAFLDGTKFFAGTQSLHASYDPLVNQSSLSKWVSDHLPKEWPWGGEFPTRSLEWLKSSSIMLRDGLLIASAFVPLPKSLNTIRTSASASLCVMSGADGIASNDWWMFSSGVFQFGATWFLGKLPKPTPKGLIPDLIQNFSIERNLPAGKIKSLFYAAFAVAGFFGMIRPLFNDSPSEMRSGDIQVAENNKSAPKINIASLGINPFYTRKPAATAQKIAEPEHALAMNEIVAPTQTDTLQTSQTHLNAKSDDETITFEEPIAEETTIVLSQLEVAPSNTPTSNAISFDQSQPESMNATSVEKPYEPIIYLSEHTINSDPVLNRIVNRIEALNALSLEQLPFEINTIAIAPSTQEAASLSQSSDNIFGIQNSEPLYKQFQATDALHMQSEANSLERLDTIPFGFLQPTTVQDEHSDTYPATAQ